MRYLLDTHVVIAILRADLKERYPRVGRLVESEGFTGFVSVATLWEISIKTRLGKLDPGTTLSAMQSTLEAVGLDLLPITAEHVVTAAEPEPETKDPFDRLLLAQCIIEQLRLVTFDRALVDHPMAWR